MITFNQWESFTPKRKTELLADHTFIPRNAHKIPSGYYRHTDIVFLLRKHKANPEAIQFIADMLE